MFDPSAHVPCVERGVYKRALVGSHSSNKQASPYILTLEPFNENWFGSSVVDRWVLVSSHVLSVELDVFVYIERDRCQVERRGGGQTSGRYIDIGYTSTKTARLRTRGIDSTPENCAERQRRQTRP